MESAECVFAVDTETVCEGIGSDRVMDVLAWRGVLEDPGVMLSGVNGAATGEAAPPDEWLCTASHTAGEGPS